MGDIMKKLVLHESVLDNLDLDSLMKEARETHLLTVNIKTYVDDAMAQATSTAAKVVSVSATLTQLLTPGTELKSPTTLLKPPPSFSCCTPFNSADNV